MSRFANRLYFSYGEGVDWYLFFEVLSFVVCAGAFAGVGASGGEEFNFFK